MNESSMVTTKRTRMVGTARSRSASRGAKADPSLGGAGGVCGNVRQNAASASDAIPETMNVLVSAASIAGPVLSVDRAVPSQVTTPPACPIDGTFCQSIGMNTNGQLAAIQPIVPQTRILPKS